MATNPFSNTSDDQKADEKSRMGPSQSTDHTPTKHHRNEALKLIRGKIKALYTEAPDAGQELAEAEAATKPLSKHQRYMIELNNSGKTLAEIQVAWHDYYNSLPDEDKNEVWQEFYEANERTSHYHKQAEKAHSQKTKVTPNIEGERKHSAVVREHATKSDRSKTEAIKRRIADRVSMQGKIKVKHHLKSLAFGLAAGSIVLIIFLFSFFNEVIIAPFIQPSRQLSSTPLIVNASGVAATSTPQVIIPKINVEIPVDYNVKTDDESLIEDALQGGVVHYPSTVLPGQNGNAAYFGHSSNNIFNPGKYKFAFVLLHKLVPGDTFYLTYNGKVYAYQVISKKIVPPNNVSVLNDTGGKTATATLITCDPPGTSINRLVILGEQISPSVSGNSTASNTSSSASSSSQPAKLAGNGPSLWSRLWSWL